MENHRNILVVQEDKALNSIIKRIFPPNYNLQFEVDINHTLRILEEKYFDIVVLNTKNRSGSTLEVSRRVKLESDSKVIFISTISTINSKELCFENGGDDYLTIPFYPRELLIRTKRLLNEYDQSKDIVERKGIQLLINSRAIKVNKCLVHLSETEFILFEYLLTNDRYISNAGILNYMKSKKNKDLTNISITVLINRLKQKLNKGIGMELIKCRYGLGYYLSI